MTFQSSLLLSRDTVLSVPNPNEIVTSRTFNHRSYVVRRSPRTSLRQVIDKVSVDLSGAAQTMLTTLYLKALDADFDRPVLGDRYAKEAIGRLDYDWREIGITGRWAPLVTVRTAQYDIWASQFLALHQHSTVVHLGCGLDSRVFRLDPGPGVEWYDVDYPAVIALREKIYPARPRYHLLAASATDPSWLGQIPADRPVLLLAEGISMYLMEHQGFALLRRIVDRFPSGELQIDFYNWFGIRSQKAHTLVRRSGSTLHWAVNSPQDVLSQLPGVRLLTAVSFFDASTFSRAPVAFQLARRLVRAMPPLRNTLQYHRYAFGPVKVK
jgi:O-methyltransferase involved in polyketide biosynthesis